MVIMKGHTNWVTSLVVYRGDLYSASHDNTIRRWTLDGKPLQILGNSCTVLSLAIWNDTLVSGGENEIIQWTGDNFNVELNSLLQNLSLGRLQITECSLNQQDFKSENLFFFH